MGNNDVVRRMFTLQKEKIDLAIDTISSIAEVMVDNLDDIPKDVASQITNLIGAFLLENERIDRLRQENIDGFYNGIRDKYERIYRLEVQDGKEDKEEK